MPQAFVQFQYTERFQNRILFSQAIYLCAFYEDITVIRTLSNFNRPLYDQCRTNNISMSMLSCGNVTVYSHGNIPSSSGYHRDDQVRGPKVKLQRRLGGEK